MFEAEPGWGGQLASWMKQNIYYVVPAVLLVAIVIVLLASGDSDQAAILNSPTQSASPIPSGFKSELIVQKGDSYTTLARRSITEYLTVTKTTASPGARIYMETSMRDSFQGQPLVAGEKVGFYTPLYFTTNVPLWLEKYEKLTTYQKARWEAMARNIKF